MTPPMSPEQQKLYDKLSTDAKALADKVMAKNDPKQMVVLAAIAGLHCTAEAFKAGKISQEQLYDIHSSIVHFLWCESSYTLCDTFIKSFTKHKDPMEFVLQVAAFGMEGNEAAQKAAERFRNLMELVRQEEAAQ